MKMTLKFIYKRYDTLVSILLFLLSTLSLCHVVSLRDVFFHVRRHQYRRSPISEHRVSIVNRLDIIYSAALYRPASHSMTLQTMWIDSTRRSLVAVALPPKSFRIVVYQWNMWNHISANRYLMFRAYLPATLKKIKLLSRVNRSFFGPKSNNDAQLTSWMERLLNEAIFKLFSFDKTLRGVCAGDSLGLLLRSLRRNLCEFSLR